MNEFFACCVCLDWNKLIDGVLLNTSLALGVKVVASRLGYAVKIHWNLCTENI